MFDWFTKPPEPNEDKHRLHLEMGKKAHEHLVLLQERIGAKSKTEVIRSALNLFELISIKCLEEDDPTPIDQRHVAVIFNNPDAIQERCDIIEMPWTPVPTVKREMTPPVLKAESE